MFAPIIWHITISMFYIKSIWSSKHRDSWGICISKVNTTLLSAFSTPSICNTITNKNHILATIILWSILKHSFSSLETSHHIRSTNIGTSFHKFVDIINTVWCQKFKILSNCISTKYYNANFNSSFVFGNMISQIIKHGVHFFNDSIVC